MYSCIATVKLFVKLQFITLILTGKSKDDKESIIYFNCMKTKRVSCYWLKILSFIEIGQFHCNGQIKEGSMWEKWNGPAFTSLTKKNCNLIICTIIMTLNLSMIFSLCKTYELLKNICWHLNFIEYILLVGWIQKIWTRFSITTFKTKLFKTPDIEMEMNYWNIKFSLPFHTTYLLILHINKLM